MVELHELLTRFGLENPERPAGDRLIYSALVLKLERLRIGHAAAALHLEADVAAEILFIVVEVDSVASGDNFAVGYPLDDPAIAGRIGGDGYRVRFLVDFDIGHERHIAVAVKVADSVGGLVIFARGKEVAVFHRFFDIRFVVLGQDEELERSADLVKLFGIVIGKSPDISALGDNDLKQLIPELAVAAGDSVGVVDYLHAEAARAVDEYAREIGYVDIPVRTVRESAGIDPVADMVEHGIAARLFDFNGSGSVVVFDSPLALTVGGEISVDMGLRDNSHIAFDTAAYIGHTSAAAVKSLCDALVVLFAHRVDFSELVENAVCLSLTRPAVCDNAVVGHRKDIIVRLVIFLDHLVERRVAVARVAVGVEVCFVGFPCAPVDLLIGADYRIIRLFRAERERRRESGEQHHDNQRGRQSALKVLFHLYILLKLICVKEMIENIVAEEEILERPDNGIELEISPVEHCNCGAQGGREVVGSRNSDLAEVLAVSSDNEGLRIADAVVAGDIESDIEIWRVEQIVRAEIEGRLAAVYIRLALDNIAVRDPGYRIEVRALDAYRVVFVVDGHSGDERSVVAQISLGVIDLILVEAGHLFHAVELNAV